MTEFRHILVPLNGSPLAERAIPLATALAEKFGSEIFLRWTFGGVAAKVARHSPCPVLLVRYASPEIASTS